VDTQDTSVITLYVSRLMNFLETVNTKILSALQRRTLDKRLYSVLPIYMCIKQNTLQLIVLPT